jgi:hypothetical protein
MENSTIYRNEQSTIVGVKAGLQEENCNSLSVVSFLCQPTEIKKKLFFVVLSPTPKCENFGLLIFTLINHISGGDLGNRIFLFILKTEADFRHFFYFLRMLSVR